MFILQWYGWPQLPATARAREFLISRAGWLLLSPLGGAKGSGCAKGDYETEFPLRWMQKDMYLASVSERQLPYLSKEVAHGHSEVAVINLSDAR